MAAGTPAGIISDEIVLVKIKGGYRQHSESRLFRFCTGKNKWSGSICHYHGREVQDIPGVLAVFAERRQDRNSPYVILRSVTLN